MICYVGCVHIVDVNGGTGSGRDANKNVCANIDPYDNHNATDRTENYVTANARLVNIEILSNYNFKKLEGDIVENIFGLLIIMLGNAATNAAVKCYGVMNKFHGSQYPMLSVLIMMHDNIS